MKKHFYFLLLAALLVPWAVNAQTLPEYNFAVDATEFNSIVSTGTAMSFSTLDDGYASTTLPFDFSFGESTFTAGSPIACSANGFIYLGASSTSGTTGSYAGTSYHAINALLQADGHLGRNTGAGAYYLYDDENGTFTIEYHLLGAYSTPYGAYSYQVVLHTNGDIEFIYDSVNHGGATSRNLATYLVNAADDRIFITGDWDSPAVSLSYATRPLTPEPEHGLRYTFSRPILSCYRPIQLVVSDIDTASFILSWSDTVGASEYILSLGDGTIFSTTDTFYNFTDLTPNTVYLAQVASVCTEGDTSTWSSIELRTACAPISSLPYVQNFDNCPTGSANLFDPCWSIFSTYSSTAYWPYASSGYLYMYIYSSAGLNGHYGYAIMPELNEDLVNDDLELTFDTWKSSSSGYCNGLIVGLFDGGVYDENHPIDTIAVIIPTATSQATAVTQYVVIPADMLPGKRIGFLYENQDPNASANYYYAYIDNVDLHVAPTCSHVINLDVPAVTANSAYLTWDMGPAGEYVSAVVEYRDTAAGEDWTVVNTEETSVVLSGLDSNTYYEVRVAAVCDGDDQAEYEYTSFHTVAFGCIFGEDALEATVGNGTTTNSYIPSYSFYNYSYTQQFFKASEIGGSGTITQITLTPSAVTSQRTYEIYMGQSNDSSATSFITPDGLVCVYNGGHIPLTANEPVTFVFTTPFNYVDTSNLVVIFRDMTGSYSSGTTWYGHTAWSNSSRYVYNDGSAYAVPPTDAGTSSNFRNNITFFGGECIGISSCSTPAAWVNEVTRNSVSLEWIPGAEESSWVIYYETLGSMVYVETTTETQYEVDGLTASTDYTIYIGALCDDDTLMTSVSVTTGPDDALDTLPFVCDFENPELNGAWLREGNGQSNKWYVGAADGNHILMVSDDNGVTNSYNISSTSASHAYVRLTLPAGEYAYSFDWRAGGESSLDYLLAYIVPDSYTPAAGSYSVPANAIRIDGGSYLNQHTDWQTRSDVINIPDSGIYKMVFTWRNDGSVGTQPPAAIDNIVLTLNTCPRPSAIVLDTATTSSVTFHWTDTSASTTGGYTVEYNGIVDNTMDTFYTATGLSASTGYTFRVYSICDDEDTSTAVTLNAFTACGDVSLPYNEGFEAYSAGTSTFPICWTNYSNTSNYVQATYGVNSSNALHFAGPGVVVTPRIPLEGNRIVLSCWLRAESTTSSGSMHIGFTTDPEGLTDYVEITEIQPTTILTRYSDIYFDSASADTGYVVFRQDPSASTNYYWWLDDLNIVDMGTCPRPNNLTATNATISTVELSWTDRGTPTSWVIEYGPMGFELGTGTQIAVQTNPYTLTGLTPSYYGDFYVRAVCGAGDSSDFSGSPCRFSTTQAPATLPYNYDFEDPAEWANWQTNSNHDTYNWYRGTDVADSGNYSIYVASSDSTYFSYAFDAIVNAAAFRDVDFGPIDSSYTLTFRARAGGTTTNYYDGLMVFLVDPTIPTVASESGITSPWGNVNDLYRIATMRLDTTWQTYEASFDTISGIHRVAFFWFNQNTGASYTNIPQSSAVDNIHIDYSSCPRPLLLEATSTTASTATLEWRGAENATYEVVYRQVGGHNQTLTTNTNSITISGLESAAEYRAWVRKFCGVGDTSLYSDGIAFNTDLCEGAVIVATGDPDSTSTTSYNAPVNNYYNYTLTQTIIDSAELGGAMVISTIAYYYDYSSESTDKNDVNIWIQPTNKSVFSSSSDIVALDTNNAIMVYSGNLNCSQGWNYFAFTTPYPYNGNGNLLVIVDDNSGAYDGSAYVFRTAPTTGYKTITRYSDSNNPDIYDLPSFSGSSSYYQWRPVMQLISCGAGCFAPVNLTADTSSYNSLTFNWNDGDSAEAVLMAGYWDENAIATATSIVTTAHTATFTGLQPNEMYTVGVRTLCEESTSEWVIKTVHTADLPCEAPAAVTVSATTFDGATVAWTAGTNATSWEVRVYNNTYDETYTTEQTTYTFTGLNEGTFNVSVRSICSEEISSEWSEPIQFTTESCVAPTNVAVSGITANSAVVSWTAAASSNGRYTMEYGFSGFSRGQGTTVEVTGTTYTITGLESEAEYDVYVASYCGENIVSPWSTVTSFTTIGGQETYTITVQSNNTAWGTVTGGGTYPAGTQVTLTATATSIGEFVEWQDGNTEAQRSIVVTGNATYTATFRKKVGIDDVDGNAIALYPNPASTTVTIAGMELQSQIVIVDMNGREVYRANAADGSVKVDVSNLSKGAYFVRITGEKTNAIRKLVVK